MAGGASGQEPKREDVEALLETRRELGPEYDDALLESFVDRVERAVADRAGAATPAPQPPPRVDTGAGARQLALGLASLVALVPLTAIAQNESGDRLLMVFVVVVLINLVHALQSRPRR